MIWETLSFIKTKLNTAIRSRYGLAKDMVKIASPPTSNQPPADNENNIYITLVNIEPEYTASDATKKFKQNSSPDLFLNIYILVSAISTDENYDQTIKMLGGIISFFQANPVFDGRIETGLPPAVERLTLEIVKLALQEQSNMWTILGARYTPSVLYKARLIRFQNEQYSPEWPLITGVKQN